MPTYGVGNFTNKPAFVNWDGGDLRLSASSPCINGENNDYVASTTDLDANPRISGGTVDTGAYEFVFTPQMELGRLILEVEEADLAAKRKQPLLATLNAAMSSLNRGNTTAALNQLSAFQNQARDQVIPWNPTLADTFIAVSHQLIAALKEN